MVQSKIIQDVFDGAEASRIVEDLENKGYDVLKFYWNPSGQMYIVYDVKLHTPKPDWFRRWADWLSKNSSKFL